MIFLDSERDGKLLPAAQAIPGSLAGVAVAFDVIHGTAVRAVIGVDEPVFTYKAAGCLVQKLIIQSDCIFVVFHNRNLRKIANSKHHSITGFVSNQSQNDRI